MAESPINEVILTHAQGFRRVRGDSGEFERYSLRDQILADRYLKSLEATEAGKGLGVKMTRTILPGSV